MVAACRGVRGAITVEENTSQAILAATKAMLEQLLLQNRIQLEDIAAVFFTMTPDLNADFPAKAARELGWYDTALMCSTEIGVPESLQRCIRVLLLWNTERQASEIVHCYLRGAEALRPERALSSTLSEDRR